jgi:CRISPR-associated Csx2 family protein
MHHLVSLIGKQDRKPGMGYKPVEYDPQDGTGRRWPRSTLFGLALLRSLRAGWDGSPPVDRVVFLGTKGSSFDVLAEELKLDARLTEGVRRAAAHNDGLLDRSHLDPLEEEAAEKLDIGVSLRLIKDARDEEGQLDPLRELMQGIEHGDLVSLDVTHGFRHLPMLALASALLLRKVRGAVVRGLYYGALESPESTRGHVVRLTTLVGLADWLGAFAILEHTGDFGPFARLLERDGLDPEELARAAHLERVGGFQAEGKILEEFVKTAPGWPGLSGVFEDEVRKRLQPMINGSLYDRQRHVATLSLKHGDLFRAAIIGNEAVITRLTTHKFKGKDPAYEDLRKRAREEFVDGANKVGAALQRRSREAYEDLYSLRNAVAHVDRAKTKRAQDAMATPESMAQLLASIFDLLLPEDVMTPL